MFLCIFFLFVYIFLEFISIAGPQAQTQFFTQHSATGFLWEGHTNTWVRSQNVRNMLMNWIQTWLCRWLSMTVQVGICILVFYSLRKKQMVALNVNRLSRSYYSKMHNYTWEYFRETGFCFWSDRRVFALAHTFCSTALLRLLEVSSRTATNVPSPRPRDRTRNIPLRLCGCTAKDLALSARQLLAHHLLRR